MENEQVVVIGGGIIGITTAFMLKMKSPRTNVVILERNSGAAMECSYQNGSVLSYSSCDVWPSPGLISTFFKGFWSAGNKFQMNFWNLLDPSFWLFTFRFMWNCREKTFQSSSEELWKLGQRSYFLHLSLREKLAAEYPKEMEGYNFLYPGTLFLFDTNSAFEHAKIRGEHLNKILSQRFVYFPSRKLCTELEPQVDQLKASVIGCGKNLLETIGSHDSYKLSQVYLGIGQKLGVQVLYNAEVASFHIQDNKVLSLTLVDGRVVKGDKFVLCAGIQSKSLGKMMGWTPPLWATKGYSMNVQSKTHVLKTVLHPYGDFGTYLVPQEDGFRYSYFAEFTNDTDTFVDPKKVQKAEELLKTYTGFDDLTFSHQRACLRPVSCDDLPIIGQFPKLTNAYLNIGQGSRGSLLAFGSAELCAEVMLGQPSPLVNQAAFSPNRFYL